MMLSAVFRMKFSYRVTALTLLVTTMIVLYFSWGDDLMMWDNKTTSKKDGSTTRPMLSTTTSVPRKTTLYKPNVADCMNSQAQSLANISTYSILHEVNAELAKGVDMSRFVEEGAPIPENKIDHTYKENPLKVIVIPHSHSDPGWHKTVFGYFSDQTKPTLNFMVKKLLQHPNMTFIWAESVFLHMWWAEIDPAVQKQVKYLIRRGQLEIVVGSWVVPDEANPHIYALIDQMIEGHQWLENHLGLKPENTWSLDPFGYSSTHPYLYQRAGYNNMVILRVHERVKAHLEQRMALEFFWKQNWDSTGESQILTQMMPYKLYNIKHTCGPNQSVCLEFDFRRIPGEFGESRSVPVDSRNIDRLAKSLTDQYKLKSSLFKHDVLLVPLGDDFRYDRELEWDQQYTNYQKLFDYINSHPNLNVQARFGTVQDYFAEVRKSVNHYNTSLEAMFPSLEGDFFPYTDQNDEYWAGYFTSRPYDKMLGRELEVQLRAAEILHVMAAATHRNTYLEFQGNKQLLKDARYSLGLFQHHDAITGTARHYVVQDYEEHLYFGLEHAQDVIKSSLRHLLSVHPAGSPGDLVVVDVDTFIGKKMVKPNLKKMNVPKNGLRLAVFNPVAQEREDIIKVNVISPDVVVKDENGQIISCQVNPIWELSGEVSTREYELVWKANLPPLGIKVYTLAQEPRKDKKCKPASVNIYNVKENALKTNPHFNINRGKDETITLENERLLLKFSPTTGYLHSLTTKHDLKTVEVDVDFMTYKSQRSGAYIFKPEGPATKEEFEKKPLYRVMEGTLLSEVQVVQDIVNHTVRLVNIPGLVSSAVQIDNIVDMSDMDNYELIMRLNTDLKNQDLFYTDLNALQVMKRKAFKNFPIEANYYPSTTFVYIEDESTRLSLVSCQSLGASSQAEGSLELMLDRRLKYDDGRGLGEGILDNRRTPSRFHLLVEELQKSTNTAENNNLRRGTFPSLQAHILANWLRHYPIISSLGLGKAYSVYKPLTHALPCDIQLVNFRSLRTLPRAGKSIEAALILHRVGYDCDITHLGSSSPCIHSPDGSIVLKEWFGEGIRIISAKETTLTLMHDKRKIDTLIAEKLKPMHLYTYRLLLGE